MKISLQDPIGDIVTRDYRAASVFKANGIDFCCRGRRTLEEVASEKMIDPEEMMQMLESATEHKADVAIDFTQWPIDLLVDYIEKKHHRFVRSQLPVIADYVEHVYRSHGRSYAELGEVRDLFYQSSEDLLNHLEQEESTLFPMIRNLLSPVDIQREGSSCVPPAILDSIIQVMMYDHTTEGDRWNRINTILAALPLTCNTAFVTKALLQDFEQDLHEHIHLENNILFPSAQRIRKEKLKAQMS
jgi:regulator of cell morphogenesis and NO signaling